MASIRFDLPAPLGPITDVKLRNGPITCRPLRTASAVFHYDEKERGEKGVLVGLEVADLDLLQRHGRGVRGGRGTRSTSELTRGVICDGSRRSHSSVIQSCVGFKTGAGFEPIKGLRPRGYRPLPARKCQPAINSAGTDVTRPRRPSRSPARRSN